MKISYVILRRLHQYLLTWRFRLKIPLGDDPFFINEIHMDTCIYIWVSYNDLTTTSLEIMVSKGNYPQMALIQVSELL